MKKILAILLVAVMLLSLTVTATYAEGEAASKITSALADRIAAAAEDEKLPVAVTADLSVTDEEREVCERYAAEQADVPYGGHDDFFNRNLPEEELKLWNENLSKWGNYSSILYAELKDIRMRRINEILDVSGADIEDMDGGYYTTGCMMLPKKLALTPVQINALAELDSVTALGVSTAKDRTPSDKDTADIFHEELASKLDEISDSERIGVRVLYGVFNSPYKNTDNKLSDQIIKDLYGFDPATVNKESDNALQSALSVNRRRISSDYNDKYVTPLRLKALDLSDEDIYTRYENGTPNIKILNLTKSKIYEIIRNDNITRMYYFPAPYENPPVPEEPSAGWFIVGTMTDWKIDKGYKLADTATDDSTLRFTMYMSPDDSFKIVYSPDGKTLDNAEFYPEGRGNAFNQENPIILQNGFYSFLFRPACDGGITYTANSSWWGYGKIEIWYYNCIYCVGRDPWVYPVSPNKENPDPEHNDPEPGYYVVGTMTDWELNKNYKLKGTGQGFTEAASSDIILRMCDKFKIAYSEDGVNITRWYPEGEGNAYNEDVRRIFYDHYMCKVVFTPYGSSGVTALNPPSHYGMIFVERTFYPSDKKDPVPISSVGELFKAKLKNDYSLSDEDFSEYEELCYHKDKDGITDWALLKAKSAQTEARSFCDVISNRAYVQDELSSPFESSYAVYDAAKKEFIPLTGDIVTQYKDLGRIFDKVGEGRLIGDVDSDGELSAIDCTFIQRYATRIGNWPENDEIENAELRDKLNTSYYSDFDRDGERDIVDATRLQRYVTMAG